MNMLIFETYVQKEQFWKLKLKLKIDKNKN